MNNKVVYQTNSQGFYIGEELAYDGLLPSKTVEVQPEILEGFIPKWNGSSWDQIENHIGESGFINNEPFEVTEYGPYPTGWTKEKVYKPSEARQLKDAEVPNIILKMNDQGVYYDAVNTTFPTTSFAINENLLVGQTIAEGSNDYWITTIDGSQKKMGINNYMQLQNRIKSHYNNVRKAGIAYREYLRTVTTSEEILVINTEEKMQEIYQSYYS